MPSKYRNPTIPASYHWHSTDTGLLAITLTLPLPSRHVSPNASNGHSRGAAILKSRHVKLHRTRASLITRASFGTGQPPTVTGYTLAFHWPTKAYRDDDNADASVKSYRDGIADALAIDDRTIRKLALSTHHLDRDRPRLEITLHTTEPDES